MPTITDTLRARWRPEYAERTGLGHAFETALSFVGAGAAKRAEFAKPGTLSDRGVAEEVLKFAASGIVPELKKFRTQVTQARVDLEQRRKKLAEPKIDPTDVAAAFLRQEYRSYLRGLSLAERAAMLLKEDSDPALLAAALEVPAELSGLTAELRARMTEAYVQRTAPEELKAMEQAEEALGLVNAAIGVAESDLKPHLAMGDRDFRSMMAAAA